MVSRIVGEGRTVALAASSPEMLKAAVPNGHPKAMACPMRIRRINKAMRVWSILRCLFSQAFFNIKMLGIIAMVSVTMTSYKTLGATLANDARPFTRGELYAYISEKTQVWSEGRVFHSEAGTLLLLWEGKYGKGTWTTDDNGALCWHVWSWDEVLCQAFYHNDDVVSIVFNGETLLAPELQEGNTLANLPAGAESSAKFVLGRLIYSPGKRLSGGRVRAFFIHLIWRS
jgi:hypothetical protein